MTTVAFLHAAIMPLIFPRHLLTCLQCFSCCTQTCTANNTPARNHSHLVQPTLVNAWSLIDPPSKRTRICGHGRSSDSVQRLSLAGGSKVAKRSVDNRSTTWFASSKRPLIFFPNTVMSNTANKCERWEIDVCPRTTSKVSHSIEHLKETCSIRCVWAGLPESVNFSSVAWTRLPSCSRVKLGVGLREYGPGQTYWYLNSSLLTSTGCVNFSFSFKGIEGIQGRRNGKSFTNFEKVSFSSLRALPLLSFRPPRASVSIPGNSRPNMR